MIEEIQASMDETEREALITEFSKAVNELCPQVPLYMSNNTRAYRSGLQGFNCNAAGTTYYEQMSWGN